MLTVSQKIIPAPFVWGFFCGKKASKVLINLKTVPFG